MGAIIIAIALACAPVVEVHNDALLDPGIMMVGETIEVVIAGETDPVRAVLRLIDTAPSLWRRGHRVQFCTADAVTCADGELFIWPARPWPDWVVR